MWYLILALLFGSADKATQNDKNPPVVQSRGTIGGETSTPPPPPPIPPIPPKK